ncbi:MAG TPA: Ni,Fe-hydrogenase III large subunit, partial [Candidatus Tenderia sp.]|nr:Ni,Fe-hydrogenase III large subunit [Candidatus Tenderia sp.]
MSRFDWLSEYLARLQDEHVVVRHGDAVTLAPAHLLELDAEDWGRVAEVAAAFGCRWAGIWGDADVEQVVVRACLVYQGDYVVLATEIPLSHPVIVSHTPWFPAADRMERHLQDMFGIAILDHPDGRRWTRHQAWAEDCYPLRVDFPVAGTGVGRTPADVEYPFERIQGGGVYEIPVGPVHAGIIEPGHFRFQAVGEEVLNLEERLGYVHKGIEKLAVGRDAMGLARLAGRVSGDSTVAHCWAACIAMERATETTLPERANMLRALLAERERVANHLGDIGAICNDVGFAFMLVQCSRLRELWQRRSQALFGHRFMMDAIIPGGVAHDLDAEGIETLLADHRQLREEIKPLFDIVEDQPSLDDRLTTTGQLSPELAVTLGCTGYVGKASGQSFDVRIDHGYAPYDQFSLTAPLIDEGDVAARVAVRMEEIHSSLDLMDKLLENLPDGAIATAFNEAKSDAQGIGFVDGWRGEI